MAHEFKEPSKAELDEFHTYIMKLLNYTERNTGLSLSYQRIQAGELGAYTAVVRAVMAQSPKDGFEYLYANGELRLSLEAAVVSTKWRNMFTEEVYVKARRRLLNYGHKVAE